MGFRKAALNYILKGIFNLICRIDSREYVKALSENKPLLVIVNHVNFLEVPILAAHSYPIKLSALAKAETWKNPLFAFIFNTYNAIPIDREGAFREPFKRVRNAIDKGFFVCIAPEGTRNKNGVLGKGKGGIIQLALDADVPILPVAHHGGEKIWENIKKIKKTNFCIKAGRPFRIKIEGRPGKKERESILEELMGQLAVLLPKDKRGIYSDNNYNDLKFLEYI